MVHIHWFRRDFRLHDNPGLLMADDDPLLPVFVYEPTAPLGAAARWRLHQGLAALRDALGGLLILSGPPGKVLSDLARSYGARRISWNRLGEPGAQAEDARIKAGLHRDGVEGRDFPANLLAAPWQIHTQAGAAFKVFTPFFRTLRAQPPAMPLPTARPRLVRVSGGLALDDLDLCPRPNWTAGWEDIWQPGEAGALARLEDFVARGLAGYAKDRDYPAKEAVSRLSAHLHWGELSVRSLWHRIAAAETPRTAGDVEKYLSEVAWRDFAYHLYFHAPELASRNWNPAFDRYPWREDDAGLAAWQHGRTGFALVDAGMRQLWATGGMHNRARMVTASFLTKHLGIHWTRGLAWFADTLVDADAAVNAASWQWVAGSGADAAPYFRIFNPTAQAAKFDPDGAYVRRWCPDAGRLPPIVDHAAARQRALDGYRHMRD